MISVREACERLVAQVQPGERALLRLDHALNRVLAEDIASPLDFPIFDNSSMDGFAVIALDLTGASPESPVILPVVGDIPAGTAPSMTLSRGQAARIMTGAPLPAGADAVIPVEATDHPRNSENQLLPDKVAIFHSALPGDYIRPHAQDFSAGHIVLKKGRWLAPQDIGLLAMLGVAQVPVFRRPKVALLSSGDEIVPVDQPLLPGKIHDANSHLLSALLNKCGVEIIPLGVARDNYADLETRLDQAVLAHADLILSTAGVSVGSFDFIRSVIADHGDIDFWQVNLRPGKPVAFGHYKNIPMLGLPGNPVSAFVGFEIFARPVLARLQGLDEVRRLVVNAIIDEPIESDGRESYLRVVLTHQEGVYHARLASHQGSGNLLSLVLANALLIVPSEVKSLPAGTTLQAWAWEIS